MIFLHCSRSEMRNVVVRGCKALCLRASAYKVPYRLCSHLNATSPSALGYTDYDTERKNFQLTVPQYYNFASDVIDSWAEKEKVVMKINLLFSLKKFFLQMFQLIVRRSMGIKMIILVLMWLFKHLSPQILLHLPTPPLSPALLPIPPPHLNPPTHPRERESKRGGGGGDEKDNQQCTKSFTLYLAVRTAVHIFIIYLTFHFLAWKATVCQSSLLVGW